MNIKKMVMLRICGLVNELRIIIMFQVIGIVIVILFEILGLRK